jgi:phage terminase large subunit
MNDHIKLPALLDCPDKLKPVITDINRYKYVLLTGGRGGGKTELIARACLYWGEQKKLHIVCGRETQETIQDSVHKTLSRISSNYKLKYDCKKSYIKHLDTDSQFIFKGFKEQGRANIKGLDDVDILWVDEAEQLTDDTLDIIIPTIRKENSIIIFTMNRKTRNDAVFKRFAEDPDCLHIHINYDENPFCPQILKDEAQKARDRDEREYNHIWKGMPLDQNDDYLFNVKKLDDMLTNQPHGDVLKLQRVIGFDYAAQGNDLCCATIIERKSPVHWKIIDQITWSDPDPDVSRGKIINIIAQYQPDLSVMDIGGQGYVVWAGLSKTGLPIFKFDGGSKAFDSFSYANTRAEGYYELNTWVNQNYLIMDPKFKEMIAQMENIRFKYQSSGRRLIQSKIEMKKDGFHSPDETDSLMMAVYGAIHYLGKTDRTDIMDRTRIVRKSESKRYDRC